jgi:hypothetical protein
MTVYFVELFQVCTDTPKVICQVLSYAIMLLLCILFFLCNLLNDSFSNLFYLHRGPNDWTLKDNEMERIWKEYEQDLDLFLPHSFCLPSCDPSYSYSLISSLVVQVYIFKNIFAKTIMSAFIVSRTQVTH